MARKSSGKERYNFLIDKSVYDDFSLLCDDLGLVRGKQVENFMRDFVFQRQEELARFKEIKNGKRRS